jgi:hypothetical protein
MRVASIAIAFIAGTAFASFLAIAWTGPTSAPPNGNVSAPVNVGAIDQVKDAALGVEGLAVFGNSILEASSYLNWGTVSGSSGYGIRDKSGTLEFKNSGGNWASLNTAIQNYLTLNGYEAGGGVDLGERFWTGAGGASSQISCPDGSVMVGFQIAQGTGEWSPRALCQWIN